MEPTTWHTSPMIRRKWLGFGECEISVIQLDSPPRCTPLARLFAGVAPVISRLGLARLRFTVDPAWILSGGPEQTDSVAAQFLRIHGHTLAEEWQATNQTITQASHTDPHLSGTLQSILTAEVPEATVSAAVDNPGETSLPQEAEHSRIGIPSWFQSSLAGVPPGQIRSGATNRPHLKPRSRAASGMAPSVGQR
jgi:hypothetical protein